MQSERRAESGMKLLRVFADLAAISTALVAVFAYGSYRLTNYQRRRKLENLLAKKALQEPHDGTLAIEQLAAYANLTTDQVIEATAASRKIESYEGDNKDRRFRWIKKSN